MSKKHQHHQSEMGTQFDKLRSEGVNFRRSGDQKTSKVKEWKMQKSADSWKGDGKDHINIDSYAETDLGKMLNFTYALRFNHPIFKNFATLSGFWTYIRSEERHDQLRYLIGHELTMLSRKVTNRKVLHTRAIVMDAAYHRILNNKTLMEQMYHNELPFDMYHITDTGVRIRQKHCHWVCEGYEIIKKAIQSNEKPDFTSLCDGPTKDIYESVRPVIPESVLNRHKAKENKRSRRNEVIRDEHGDVDGNANPSATSVVQSEVPTPSPSTPVPKSRKEPANRDEYNFTVGETCCLMVPHLRPSSEHLFLQAFKKTIKINGIEIDNAPIISNMNIPLIKITDHPALYSQGFISENDEIFTNNRPELSTSSDIIKLDHFYIKNGEKYIDIPLWLRLINKSFDQKHDRQVFTADPNHGLCIEREMYLYKPVRTVVDEEGNNPSFINSALELVANRNDVEDFQNLVFNLKFGVVLDTTMNVSVTGTVSLVGVTNGLHSDNNKELVLFNGENQYNEMTYPIEGYRFTLFRGRKDAKPVEAVVETIENVGNRTSADDEIDFAEGNESQSKFGLTAALSVVVEEPEELEEAMEVSGSVAFADPTFKS